ncbi:DUF6400 family protein [Streptomyces shenzhenensis]
MSAYDLTPPHGPGDPAAGRPDGSAPVDFAVDVTAHEAHRRAHVLEAIGPDRDPVEVLRGEEAAYDLLTRRTTAGPPTT